LDKDRPRKACLTLKIFSIRVISLSALILYNASMLFVIPDFILKKEREE